MSVLALTTALQLASAPVTQATMPPVATAGPAVPAPAPQDAAPPQSTVPPPSTTPPPAAPSPAPSATAQTITPPPADSAMEQEVVVTADRRHATPGDPFEDVNLKSFEVTQSVDRAVVAPVARGYKQAIPRPVRRGIGNFFRNLDQPVIFVNYVLQLKPGKAAETVGRFAINTTIGVAGLFDVAKTQPFNLPYRPNGFADSLGYYGVKPGPFFYLPLLGPTTLRDFFGYAVDRAVLPLSVGKPFDMWVYAIPTSALRALDNRVEFDDQLHYLHYETANPYAATREFYLRQRKAEIDRLHGRPGAPVPPVKPAPVNPPSTTSPVPLNP